MHIPIVGRATLKILRREIKRQFLKQERNTQIVIALLNYLKRMAPQQLLRRTEFFTKKIFNAKIETAILFIRYYIVVRILIIAIYELGSSEFLALDSTTTL
jgi:hypothetical protein